MPFRTLFGVFMLHPSAPNPRHPTPHRLATEQHTCLHPTHYPAAVPKSWRWSFWWPCTPAPPRHRNTPYHCYQNPRAFHRSLLSPCPLILHAPLSRKPFHLTALIRHRYGIDTIARTLKHRIASRITLSRGLVSRGCTYGHFVHESQESIRSRWGGRGEGVNESQELIQSRCVCF